MNPDGSGLAQLTSGFSADGTAFDEAGAPAWSPDGKRIAFGSFDRRSAARLEVMNADGSNRTTLFQTNTTGVGNPAWSPDGNKLVVTIGYGLYVIDANGGTPAPIPVSGDAPDTFSSPDWSPDGTKIAFRRILRGRL